MDELSFFVLHTMWRALKQVSIKVNQQAKIQNEIHIDFKVQINNLEFAIDLYWIV